MKKIKIILESSRTHEYLEKETEGFKKWYLNIYNEKFNLGAVLLYDVIRTNYITDTYGIKYSSSSYRKKYGNYRVYYYDVIDENKLAIFKLKYGFRMV